jgi:predicted kinase
MLSELLSPIVSASDNTPILIVTGPPGVGKTTTAGILAERSARAVHLESDAFFRFIRSGYVEPWKPESHAQNQIVMRIVAQAASGYAAAGYFTIIDGIVIPGWFLEPLRDALHDAGHRIAYAVLRAPLSVCKARAPRENRRLAGAVAGGWTSRGLSDSRLSAADRVEVRHGRSGIRGADRGGDRRQPPSWDRLRDRAAPASGRREGSAPLVLSAR